MLYDNLQMALYLSVGHFFNLLAHSVANVRSVQVYVGWQRHGHECVQMFADFYMYICTVPAYLHAYVYICIFICLHMHMYMYMHMYLYMSMYLQLHLQMYTDSVTATVTDALNVTATVPVTVSVSFSLYSYVLLFISVCMCTLVAHG